METPPLHIPDPGGLICGFLIGDGGPAVPLASATEVWEASAPAGVCARTLGDEGRPARPFWLNLNLADARARHWIETCGRLPPAAREQLLSPETRVRVVPAGSGLAGVLVDLDYDFKGDPEGLGVFHFYVDDGCVVTARRHPLRALDKLRREVQGGLRVSTPARLVAHLVALQADALGAVVGELSDRVDDVEDHLLKDRYFDRDADLGGMRRLFARLRRHAGAGRLALGRAIARPPDWCDEADAVALRSAVERLDAVGHDVESAQERARLLQEELARRLAEATNRNLYVLSVVTAIGLPLTLITGVFGMNVGGLPWNEHPAGFWWVMGTMALCTVAALAYLRWRRFF